MKSFGQSFINSILSTILMVMFFIIILFAGLTTLASYSKLQAANFAVVHQLESIKSLVSHQQLTDCKKITQEANLFLKSLDGNIQGNMEINTVSFLFQLFTFCLVSVGVYLLSRSKKLLDDAEVRANHSISILNAFTFGLCIEGLVSEATISCHKVTSNLSVKNITTARESTSRLRSRLESTNDDDILLQKTHISSILDRLNEYLNVLNRVSGEQKRMLSEIISNLKAINSTLVKVHTNNKFDQIIKSLK